MHLGNWISRTWISIHRLEKGNTMRTRATTTYTIGERDENACHSQGRTDLISSPRLLASWGRIKAEFRLSILTDLIDHALHTSRLAMGIG